MHSFANSSESGDAERNMSRLTTGRITSDILISCTDSVATDAQIDRDGEGGVRLGERNAGKGAQETNRRRGRGC